jgi:ribosomal small subunit protein bTHX
MGRGDKKSRKGKIFSKSHGNSNPKPKHLRKMKTTTKAVEVSKDKPAES